MSNVINLTIDPPITAASKRLLSLIGTGYLPEQMKRDIETLMHGAMAWEAFTEKKPTEPAAPAHSL